MTSFDAEDVDKISCNMKGLNQKNGTIIDDRRSNLSYIHHLLRAQFCGSFVNDYSP